MAKRFYKHVDIAETNGGFHVTLDGRVMKTPGKKELVCQEKFQANCVAGEWDAQDEEIRPELMPFTRLINVACELTASRRPELITEFKNYCETDLLCYRAGHPADLAERQHQVWQPVLDWAAAEKNIELATTTGIEALDQPARSLRSAAEYAEKQDDINLTLLLHYTASFGSSVLGLGVLETYLEAGAAFDISKLDEQFQNERWGKDDEAMAKNKALREELVALSGLIKEGTA